MTTEPTLMSEAATEAALDIESIKELMDAFDPASLLPELDSIFDSIITVCQISVMIAPIIILVLGLAYLLFAPKEANYYFGYRCYYGMGSVEAWQFTQRLSGIVLGGLGLILSGIMLLISRGFPDADAMDMVWTSLRCLLWQGGLILIANIAIWVVTAIRFDGKGRLRAAPRKKN